MKDSMNVGVTVPLPLLARGRLEAGCPVVSVEASTSVAVIDNRSGDGSVILFGRNFRGFEVIEAGANLAYGAGGDGGRESVITTRLERAE
jgi:hypothetical protein